MKCNQCGRSKAHYADDYFIPKCTCDDFEELNPTIEDEE